MILLFVKNCDNHKNLFRKTVKMDLPVNEGGDSQQIDEEQLTSMIDQMRQRRKKEREVHELIVGYGYH